MTKINEKEARVDPFLKKNLSQKLQLKNCNKLVLQFCSQKAQHLSNKNLSFFSLSLFREFISASVHFTMKDDGDF